MIMKKAFPYQYDFFPETWIMPNEAQALKD